MKTIEINEVPKYIENAPAEMCLMFLGDTGIGKTTVISKYAQDHGYYFKTLVLSQLRPDEALGIPIVSKREFGGIEHDVLGTAVPEWVFELAQEEKAILFLDEFLTAKPDVMNTFLNFLTEREVSGIDLSHVVIVAATNIGMYSFQPDDNILSRFCMFYTVNSTFNQYIKDPRINNTYVDETDKEHRVFERRSLKPRCQFVLSKVENDDLLEDYYQGYTNRKMYPKFSTNSKVNTFLESIYDTQSNHGFVEIDENNIGAFIQYINANFPRVKDVSKTFRTFTDNVKFVQEINGEPVVEFINFRLSV